MAKTNKPSRIRIQGAFDFDGKDFMQPANGVEYSFESSGPSYYGNTFTPRACAELIYQKVKTDLTEIKKGADPILAIEFGRDSLFRILSQEGCEAIRFTFCKTLDDQGKISEEESLVAMGLDSTGQLLKPNFYKEKNSTTINGMTPPLAEEKGNKVRTSVIIKNMGMEIDFENFINNFTVPLI